MWKTITTVLSILFFVLLLIMTVAFVDVLKSKEEYKKITDDCTNTAYGCSISLLQCANDLQSCENRKMYNELDNMESTEETI